MGRVGVLCGCMVVCCRCPCLCHCRCHVRNGSASLQGDDWRTDQSPPGRHSGRNRARAVQGRGHGFRLVLQVFHFEKAADVVHFGLWLLIELFQVHNVELHVELFSCADYFCTFSPRRGELECFTKISKRKVCLLEKTWKLLLAFFFSHLIQTSTYLAFKKNL